MKKTKYILAFLFLFANFTLTSQTVWEVLNPKPSYKTGLDIEFISDNKGFIINEDELLETDDAGATWYIKQTITSANDMDFYNSTGFIAGYQGYVLRTTDAGTSWEQISTGTYENINTVNVINEQTIILSTFNQLIKSSNAGEDWETIDIPDVTVNKTCFVSDQVGVAVCINGTIVRTINGGQDWYITAESNTFPSDYLAVTFINENIGFASREPSELFKTTDGGESWTALSPLSQPIYSIFFINENMGYVAGDNGVMYKTLNGGNNWFWVGFQDALYYFSSIYGMYFTDENHGYATGDRGRILKTSSGAMSWEEYSPIYNDIKKLQFVNNEKGYMLVGNDFYRTINGGNDWEYRGSPAHYEYSNGFQFISENIGYSIGGGSTSISGTVFKTIDGGINWTILNGGNQVIYDALYSLFFINEEVGMVSGGYNSSKVMKTIDGGDTWTQVGDVPFGQIQFVNDTLGFARTTGYYSRIYKTTDAGDNWEVNFEIEEDINSFDFVNENVGYFTGDNGLMYKTTDGGANWAELDIPWEYYISVKFINADTGYLIDEDGKLYKTENGGQNWNQLTTIYGINDLEFSNSNVYLYGTYGKILTASLSGNLGINEDSYQDPVIQLTPNPADEYINIISSQGSIIISVEIIDLHGNIILNQADLYCPSVRLNLGQVIPGVYFSRIMLENDDVAIRKLLIK